MVQEDEKRPDPKKVGSNGSNVSHSAHDSPIRGFYAQLHNTVYRRGGDESGGFARHFWHLRKHERKKVAAIVWGQVGYELWL